MSRKKPFVRTDPRMKNRFRDKIIAAAYKNRNIALPSRTLVRRRAWSACGRSGSRKPSGSDKIRGS